MRENRHLGLLLDPLAAHVHPLWQIRLQLTKPGTWIPLIWGVACGAAASGNYHSVWNLFGDAPTTDSVNVVVEDTFKALAAMFLSGPLLTGYTQVKWRCFCRCYCCCCCCVLNGVIFFFFFFFFFIIIVFLWVHPTAALPHRSHGGSTTRCCPPLVPDAPLPNITLSSLSLPLPPQTINDWYDRELDAVNEPYRPIPSGAISEGEVIFQAWFLLLSALVLAFQLDQWAANDWPVILACSVPPPPSPPPPHTHTLASSARWRLLATPRLLSAD